MSDNAFPVEKNDAKVIHNRRSSIFNSRAMALRKNDETSDEIAPSIGSQCQALAKEKWDTDVVDNPTSTTMLTAMPHQTDEPFDLQYYIKELAIEKKAWRKMCIDRKAKRRNIVKETAIAEFKDQQAKVCMLSDMEQKFIMSEPSYEDIHINCKKLSNIAMEISMLSQLTGNLNRNYILRMEEKMYDVVKRVVRISESVP